MTYYFEIIRNKHWAKLLFFISFFLTVSILHAQKEASVWLNGSGKQFNFQSGGLDISTFVGNNSANSSICDKDGKLVLYSNGKTIWNRNNEIVVNGDGLISSDAYQSNPPKFVPYPKKDGWYILIYDESLNTSSKTGFSNTLYYAEIDANAQGGIGEVVRKKIKIHNNYHSSPSIAGFCNNSYYWMVIDRNENVTSIKRDRIYFYKIDENGVNVNPVINGNLDFGNSGNYKFSPNGDKLSFMVAGNSFDQGQDIVTDFNFISGEMYNIRYIGNHGYSLKEFSPNSQLLYLFSKGNLIQIDVRYSTQKLINNTADTILTLASNAQTVYPWLDLQLAPNGKLYFIYNDVIDGKIKLGIIHEPNKKGFACNLETDVLTLSGNNYMLPEFVTSFFRDKNPEMKYEVFPKAGPDLKLCANSDATIGIDENNKAFYQWIPEDRIGDVFSVKTIFQRPKYYVIQPQTSTYVLRATDGNCWVNFDTLNITVYPIPEKLPIEGSRSVCPFVEEVEYSTVAGKNEFHWLVDGGKIVSDPLNDTIKINWGDTNAKASVKIFTTNSYGCNPDTTVFPVRINVKLITETPKGNSQVCIADSKNIPYQIRKTNGSVYNWMAEQGEIMQGQGTNKVAVNWLGDGAHRLTVEETNETIDTICFGISEPLLVNVLNDSLEVKLENVSYDLENHLIIKYNSAKFQKNIHTPFLIMKNDAGENHEEIISLVQPVGEYVNSPISPIKNLENVSFKIINSCNETFSSNTLQTIFLQGNEDKSGNIIHLKWNFNQSWINDNLDHEIWYSENEGINWALVSDGEKGTSYNFPLNGLTLIHFFRIKEINKDKNLESWSNRIEIEVDGDLTVPDVFTPNGDGINDEWQIRNIRFHPFQRVSIFNKNGQLVYECRNEFIPWDGRINGNITQGTYFYQIIFDSKNKKYGQVTILK